MCFPHINDWKFLAWALMEIFNNDILKSTLPNTNNFFMCIGSNNDIFHVNWVQIMTRYDFIWAKRVILSNVGTDSVNST